MPALSGYDEKTLDDIENVVGQMIDDAVAYNQSQLSADRELATDYYYARPFGNEEEGRSKVVSTDVRDVVRGLLPTLLRIFWSPEHIVRYEGVGPEDEDAAAQATDYVRHIVMSRDNRGMLTFHGWFKEALIRRTGIVKWWWEEREVVEEDKYSGLSQEDVMALMADASVEVEITGERVAPIQIEGESVMLPVFDARVTRTRDKGYARFAVVPPEEISWSEDARSPDDARIIVHSMEKKVYELLEMGYDEEDIEEHVGPSEVRTSSVEERARRTDQTPDPTRGDKVQDPLTRPVRYDEAYVRMEVEKGEGVRLNRMAFIGNQHKLLDIEPLSSLPFGFLCPDPEPHAIEGRSVADDAMDLQRINSAILRGTLDSLSLSLTPRTEVVEQHVNLLDLMNTEIGAVVRTTAPGMIREIAHSFVGRDSIPMLEYLGTVKEDRTAHSRAAAGLDADALQSSTKMAVARTFSASQQRVELIASLFAETGVKDLFAGLLELIIKHQDRARVVRLRGKYVEIDPRSWNAEMDVVVNVALGAGPPEERLLFMEKVIGKQEQLMATLGPDNPIVGFAEYSSALGDSMRLGGERNGEKYFKPVDPQQAQQLAQKMAQQAQGQGQDPAAMAIAEAEQQKAQASVAKMQADTQIKQQELQLKAQEMELRDDRERDKQAADIALAIKEMELKYETSIAREEIGAEVALQRAQLDSVTKVAIADRQQGADTE